MEKPVSHDLERRKFLQVLASIPIGVVAGEILDFTSNETQNTVRRLTGVDVGNASVQEEMQARCGPQPDRQCEDQFASSGSTRLTFEIADPLGEEIIYRAVPSFGRDMATDPTKDLLAAARQTFLGRRRVVLTRGEFITGAVTALLFGASHNIVRRRFDTRVLPVEQVIGGGVLWALQRKFGLLSNLAAHSFFNFRWLRHPN